MINFSLFFMEEGEFYEENGRGDVRMAVGTDDVVCWTIRECGKLVARSVYCAWHW